MKKLAILLVSCWLSAPQCLFAVDTGLYYCIPRHAVHLMRREGGAVSEISIDTAGVVQVIVIGEMSIDISDSRSSGRKQVHIVSNKEDGAILGRSETRHFYMNDILHYFYGSTDAGNTVAYAEEGMCSEFTH